ncbi:hypothetical protein OIE66_42350 [Nonomuraea sp. NBC_01738]|uniref:hypothetical protein n=1 Tax=Nonomuraea sp. NBC_01738 TaxID=2976003 RepID=UPI002E15C104|nr:hypothetical protein OIE66_42350 [Nonomuraea sp. NBC_01738]
MNPNALEVKAQQRGWKVISEHDSAGPMFTLVRDDWEIWVAFAGDIPDSATLRKPGTTEHRRLPLRDIGMWVRRDPHEMSRFAIGDHVTVAGRHGIVTDIRLGVSRLKKHAEKIRLVITYEDGGTGSPYSDQAARVMVKS